MVDDITSILLHCSPFDDPNARRDEMARLGVLILIGNIITTRLVYPEQQDRARDSLVVCSQGSLVVPCWGRPVLHSRGSLGSSSLLG
jgi:hypothetical protein